MNEAVLGDAKICDPVVVPIERDWRLDQLYVVTAPVPESVILNVALPGMVRHVVPEATNPRSIDHAPPGVFG
jgi:hypothetical protein